MKIIRNEWQKESGKKAAIAEQKFFDVFQNEFSGTEFSVRSKPQELGNIYVDVDLSEGVLEEIYTPDKPIIKHGISPDYAIDYRDKTLYIEVKRQDGWVEGGERSDGRGNAHERACKYFTPGLLKVLREHGNLGNECLPFWTVFQGDITRDPCRVREVALWYAGNTAHYYMWRDSTNPASLINHFNENLKSLFI